LNSIALDVNLLTIYILTFKFILQLTVCSERRFDYLSLIAVQIDVIRKSAFLIFLVEKQVVIDIPYNVSMSKLR